MTIITGLGSKLFAGRLGPQSITAISVANPTHVTSVSHGLTTGDTIVISGSNSTPSINGSQVVTVLDADTFTVVVNVTVAGTTGTYPACKAHDFSGDVGAITDLGGVAAQLDTSPIDSLTDEFLIGRRQGHINFNAFYNAGASPEGITRFVAHFPLDGTKTFGAYLIRGTSGSDAHFGEFKQFGMEVTEAVNGALTVPVVLANGGSGPIYGKVAWIGTDASATVHTATKVDFGTAGANGPQTITAISIANPTHVTSRNHGLITGDVITAAGSNSTPTIDGVHTVTVLDVDHFTITVNVTGAGTTGTFQKTTITAITLANPTHVTATAHGLVTNDIVTISGSDSTPVIDGVRTVTVVDANHFTVPVNVTVPGTTGIFQKTSRRFGFVLSALLFGLTSGDVTPTWEQSADGSTNWTAITGSTMTAMTVLNGVRYVKTVATQLAYRYVRVSSVGTFVGANWVALAARPAGPYDI